MKIILLKNVKNVGQPNDVRDVSDGYARNFLIPHGFARIAMSSDIKELERLKKNSEDANKEAEIQLKLLSKKIASDVFEVVVSAGEKGELFAAIDKKNISGEIKKKYKKEPLGDLKIMLKEPIKKLGEYAISIDLGMGISVEAKLVVKGADKTKKSR